MCGPFPGAAVAKSAEGGASIANASSVPAQSCSRRGTQIDQKDFNCCQQVLKETEAKVIDKGCDSCKPNTSPRRTSTDQFDCFVIGTGSTVD